MRPNCEDIRIIWQDPSSEEFVNLDYDIFDCNTNNTLIIFRTQQVENAGEINDYSIYYQSNSGPKIIDKSNVYFYYEDTFSNADWNYFETNFNFLNSIGDDLQLKATPNYIFDVGEYSYHERSVNIPQNMNLIVQFIERDTTATCTSSLLRLKRFYFDGFLYLNESVCPQDGGDTAWHLRSYYIENVLSGLKEVKQSKYVYKSHRCIDYDCPEHFDDLSLREYSIHDFSLANEESYETCEDSDLYPSEITFEDLGGGLYAIINFIFNSGNCGIKNVNVDFLHIRDGELINIHNDIIGDIYPNSMKISAAVWNLQTNDDLNVIIDPNNILTETIKDNNVASKEFLGSKKVYLEVDVPPGASTRAIDKFIRENLEGVEFVDTEFESDIEIFVARHNPLIVWKFFTLNNEGWGYNGNYVILDGNIATQPYGAVVGSFTEDKHRVLVHGNGVSGFVAGVKEFIRNQELYLNSEHKHLITNNDREGIAIFDFFQDSENLANYQLDNLEFEGIVTSALYDDMVDSEDLDVFVNSVNYTLRHISPIRSGNFLNYVDPDQYPIVLARGLWSSIEDWTPFGKELANIGYDVWVIELTGGASECDTCVDYTYDDLISDVLPAYVSRIKSETGATKIKYVGNSNGARTFLDSVSNGYILESEIDTAVLVGVPGNFSELTSFAKIVKDSGDLAIQRIRSEGKSHASLSKISHELESSIGEIVFIYDLLFGDGNKISINLFDKYEDWMSEDIDQQPGEGVNFDFFTLLYGNYNDKYHDQIVPVADELSIFNNIVSDNKKIFDESLKHTELAEDNLIKSYIKKSINKTLY